MENCQIFTPPTIVNKMLDMIDYNGDNIATKTILEPSFGDGAFLVPIVQRMLNYCRQTGKTKEEIVAMLDNIHGVELDKKYFDITLQKLQDLLLQENIQYEWTNLHNGDTLTYIPPTQFDYCIGNPPYIRVHDCSQGTRKIIRENYVMGKGNTDLYVIFYEKGLQCLKDTGVLCYIAPNSYFKNSSQTAFRKYLCENNLVEELIDYGTVRIFGDIDTYTTITKLHKNRSSVETKYSMMKNEIECEYSCSIDLSQSKGSPWTFSPQKDMKWIDAILKRTTTLGDLCEIQYGIATNADSVYVIEEETAKQLELEMIRPVVKASKLRTGQYIIFPYLWDKEKERYLPIEETTFKEKYPLTYAYLLQNKERLDGRDMEKGTPWYAYARSQGLQNSHNKKIALKHVLSPDTKKCEYLECNVETLIYSGIYIVVRNPKDYKKVIEILRGTELYKFLFTIGKNMSGGYKNVNAKAIKSYGIPESTKKYARS